MNVSENQVSTGIGDEGKTSYYLDKVDYLEKINPQELKLLMPEPGKFYKILELQGSASALLDNYTLVKQGNNLVVEYMNEIKIHFKDFYSICEDGQCGVILPSANGNTLRITAEDNYGMALADGSVLIYFHGDNQMVMNMINKDLMLKPVGQCVDLVYQLKQYNQYETAEDEAMSNDLWGTLLTGTFGLGLTGFVDDSDDGSASTMSPEISVADAISVDSTNMSAVENPDLAALALLDTVEESDKKAADKIKKEDELTDESEVTTVLAGPDIDTDKILAMNKAVVEEVSLDSSELNQNIEAAIGASDAIVFSDESAQGLSLSSVGMNALVDQNTQAYQLVELYYPDDALSEGTFTPDFVI